MKKTMDSTLKQGTDWIDRFYSIESFKICLKHFEDDQLVKKSQGQLVVSVLDQIKVLPCGHSKAHATILA